MVLSAEFMGLLLLVASAAALGLSIVLDVGRVSAEKTRHGVLQRQLDKKKQALKEWTAKTERKETELVALKARHTEFVGRRQKAQTETRSVEYEKIELVHEIGDDGAIGFWSLLVVQPSFPQVDRHDLIFSRQIWDYRNIVHVWAGSGDQAAALVRSAFSPRSSVQATQLLPFSFAPEAERAASPALAEAGA